jgi:DNA (cytosine-5)-methyltransferase 1
LAHHYPDVPNLGDVTKITEEQIKTLGPIDLVVFGSPCQDLSVAGKRRGLTNDDGSTTRSGLFFTARQIVEWARKNNGCRFALWENVPGAFSSSKGEDFAAVVRELAGFEDSPAVPRGGWGNEGVALGQEALVEWSTLDAQWFGVAQRRRRVFALADFGDWYSRPPILLEPESLRGNSAPSRVAREGVTEVTGTLAASGGGLDRPAGQGNELDFCVTVGALDTECGFSKAAHQSINAGHILPVATFDRQSNTQYGDSGVASTINQRDYKQFTDLVTYGIPGNWIGRKPENGGNAVEPMVDVAPCQTKTDIHAVAYSIQGSMIGRSELAGPQGDGINEEVCFTQNTTDRRGVAYRTNAAGQVMDQGRVAATLNTFTDPCAQILLQAMQVRRLTPLECERLQGFPDNYTNIPGASDTVRYKALGNSMAVPVMQMIGQQIQFALDVQGLTS